MNPPPNDMQINTTTRRAYRYESGPYYQDESYGGVRAIGYFVHEEFAPRWYLGRVPKGSRTIGRISYLENKKFAVRKQGFNNTWIGNNSDDRILDTFEEAASLLEQRIAFVNREARTSAMLSLLFKGAIIVGSIVVAVLVLFFYFK